MDIEIYWLLKIGVVMKKLYNVEKKRLSLTLMLTNEIITISCLVIRPVYYAYCCQIEVLTDNQLYQLN